MHSVCLEARPGVGPLLALVIHALRRTNPSMAVVVSGPPDLAREAVRAGADGVVPSGSIPDGALRLPAASLALADLAPVFEQGDEAQHRNATASSRPRPDRPLMTFDDLPPPEALAAMRVQWGLRTLRDTPAFEELVETLLIARRPTGIVGAGTLAPAAIEAAGYWTALGLPTRAAPLMQREDLTVLVHLPREAALADAWERGNGRDHTVMSIAVEDHERPGHEHEGCASFLFALGWTLHERGRTAPARR